MNVMARGVFERKLWRVVALPLTILQSRRVAGTAKTPFFYARTSPAQEATISLPMDA